MTTTAVSREPRTQSLPDGFVYLTDVVPGIEEDLRYSGSNNFLGKPVDGYLGSRAILTREASEALQLVQAELAGSGLGLKVFDAYRPQRAVDQFVRWATNGIDTELKSQYYPDVDKDRLIPDGYIAANSSHSRGSTVDLTITRSNREGSEELDMGTAFDFFGPESWPESDAITGPQSANRSMLRELMMRLGFLPLKEEWWHFTLSMEPFPETCFDFPVV